MPKLRYLKFYSDLNNGSSQVHLPEGLKFLPNKMRYLEWYGFPLKSLPSTFCAEKLVKLYMPHSHLEKLWNGVQDLVSLQEIDLSGSRQLQELPNLSKSLNLKLVQLNGCESLCCVHPSILSLHSLVKLSLFGCMELGSLKSEFHLKSLKHINVEGCRNLKEFSVSSDELRVLCLDETGIEILHSSVGCSSKLEELYLSGLGLVDLPDQLSCLTSLTILKLSNCEIIDDWKLHILFDGMLSLKVVELDDCCNIIELPNNAKHLLGLESLAVSHCRRLRSLSELPPSISTLVANNCKSLEIVSTCRPLRGGRKYLSSVNCVKLNEQSRHKIMEAAYPILFYLSNKSTHQLDPVSSIYVPGSKVPKWLEYRAAESSVIVELPQSSGLADFFFCIVIGFYSEIDSPISLECNCYLEGSYYAGNSRHHVASEKMKSDHVFIWSDVDHYGGIVREIIRRGNRQFTNIKLCFKFTVEGLESSKVMIKECGVFSVYTGLNTFRNLSTNEKWGGEISNKFSLRKSKFDEDAFPGIDEMDTPFFF